MRIYHFKPPSKLDAITFVENEKGGLRAYLHAREGSTQEELREIVEALQQKKLSTLAYNLDGRPALEVRGFSRERGLVKILEAAKIVEGEPRIEKSDRQISLWDQLRERSLQVAGAFYFAGDASFIAYGWKEANKLDMAGGALYCLGTLSLMLFGNNDQGDLQIEQHAKKMGHFLKEENVRIPASCALHALSEDNKKGIADNAYDWMRSHPAEMLNTIYVGAGACIAAAALKHKVLAPPKAGETAKEIFQMRAEGWLDVALGTTTSTVSLLGNIIEEKKRDPDDPLPRGMIQKAVAWVEEKPLRLTGYGLMASTLCHAFSTGIAYYKARQQGDLQRLSSVPYRAGFVLANLVAETMVALSSKGHGEGITSDSSVKESVYALAAELIAKQPKEEREWYVQNLSGFLQQPQVLAESYSVVESELRKQVAEMEKNPWMCAEPAPPTHIAIPPAPKPTATVLPNAVISPSAAAQPQLHHPA